jgi:TolB-like protein/DNA-binding winged helix-turn-helix (wHTH) protein/tetratricopeptide (TPR) repeat protein
LQLNNMVPAGPPVERILRFGVFELDVRTAELRKAGRRIRLSGQPLQILEALLRRPGEIVTREDLQQTLWPGDTFVDFERNLNSAVKRLRAALGDSADTPRYIETLPRRGYRFLVPVEVDAPTRAALPPAIPDPRPAPVSIGASRRLAAAVVGVAVVIAIGVVIWRTRPVPSPVFQPEQVKSLAVLPFQNLSSDPDQVHFADGMTDALITSLAQIKSLKVISRTSVLSYKSTARPIPAIAKELAVDAIVEGSVMRAGDQVRITAQLIHGPTDRHLWAASYDGPLADVLALHSQVARAVAHAINVHLSSPEGARLRKVDRVDPAVHELYLRGRHLLMRRTEPELERALGYFQQAVAEDPQFALAYVGIAQVWDALGSWAGYVAPKDAYPRAKAAAAKALAIDDTLAEAHTALGSVNELHDWNIAEAERRYQRAIELNPSYAEAYSRYSLLLSRTERVAAALEAAVKARALDPLSLEMNVGLGLRLAAAGKPQNALEQLLSAVELDPNYFDSHIHLAYIYDRLGSAAEAIRVGERAVALSRRNAHAVNALAAIYVRQKQYSRARALLAELGARSVQRNPYDIAMVYLDMNDTEAALSWLERACEERAPGMAFLPVVQHGRRFSSLRSHARFAKILQCVEPEAP